MFFSKNDDLAKRYKEASVTARSNILGELYRLDLHLFQAWRVLGEDREDYKQEACFWLQRALETFTPGKGPFVNWLRFYVRKTFSSHVKTHTQGPRASEEEADKEQGEKEDDPDPLFWETVKRLCATDRDWAIMDMRFRQGMEIKEIAKRMGVYPEKIRVPIRAVLDAIKASTLTDLHHSNNKVSTLDPTQSRWMRKRDLAPLLGFTIDRLKQIAAPGTDPRICPFQIDPRDIIHTPSQRIRFLETPQGLIYPRFVRRTPKRH